MNYKRKQNGFQIFKIVLGIFLILISLPNIAGNIFEISVNNERIKRDALMEDKEIIGKDIPPKSKMENPEPYNNMNMIGSSSLGSYSNGAVAFYNTTGIQLYFIEFDFGYEEFETEQDLRYRIEDEFMQLDNIDNSIVIYSYSTEHDYDSKYSYYGYEEVYYGDNVTKYLSPDDLQMINFYKRHAYDLWDYETRDSQTWITIGNMISNGYNTAEYQNINIESYDELDAEVNRSILTRLIVSLVISLIIASIGFLLIILGVMRIRRNNKYNDKIDQVEIDYHEARITKEILEADIEDIVSEEEKYLMDKYYDEE